MDFSVDNEFEGWLQELRDLAKDFAAAKEDHVRLKEFRKVKKALLMKEAMVDGIKTLQAQEREAYAHKEYLQVIKGLAIAAGEESRLFWVLKSTEIAFERWRSMEATRRTEMGRYGVG